MISLIFVFLAAICNAVMDKVSFHYSISVFSKLNRQFWNPDYSWKNKWADGPIREEKFFLSSSVLAWTTDAWHLFKTMMTLFLFLAVVLYKPMFAWYIDLIIFKVAFGATFHLFFHKIFDR